MTFSLPLIIAYSSMAIMLAFACIGSAIGVTMAGNTTIGSLKKNPDMFGKSMILCALPSTQGLYGFAGFFFMLNALKGLNFEIALGPSLAMAAAALALGFTAYFSAIWQAKLCANGINEMGNGQDVFSRTMILAVFPELYAILTFAATFLALP
ncbi:MAG: V-type ATP synthase subunit K [Bacteroidales bacterium]|nr:V-type ATP synthase subunit K [Bacteroidales bacterium]